MKHITMKRKNRKLKIDRENKGFQFTTSCDSSVILNIIRGGGGRGRRGIDILSHEKKIEEEDRNGDRDKGEDKSEHVNFLFKIVSLASWGGEEEEEDGGRQASIYRYYNVASDFFEVEERDLLDPIAHASSDNKLIII